MQLKRRDGKWVVHFTVWDPVTGERKRKRKSTGVDDNGTARNKRLAEINGAQIAATFAVGGVGKTRPLTLQSAIDIHIAAHERAGSSPVTVTIANDKAARLFEFFGPDYDVRGLTEKSLVDYADHRRLHPGRVRARMVSSGTIHRELRTLREALQDAIAEKKWNGTVPAMPDLGEVYRPREVIIDKSESQRVLLALAPARRDHFVMYRQLGLDRGELYRIEPGDIDWSRDEVRVRGTKTDARDRILPMTPEVREVMLRRVNASPMFERWHNALRDLAKACQKAGVHVVNFKDLRRSFATDLARAGVSPLILKDLMGHSTTRMLEKVYARIGRGKHMHDAMRAVPELRPDRATCVPETARSTGTVDSVGGDIVPISPRKTPEK